MHDETLDSECHCRKIGNFLKVHNGSTCGLLSTMRGPKQKVISFSLYFGNNEVWNILSLGRHILNTTKLKHLEPVGKVGRGGAPRSQLVKIHIT